MEDSPAPVPQDESPTKRAKSVSPGTKILSLDYMKCDVKDLGTMISALLNELVQINDGQPFQNNQLTRFHSR
jgi:hypothetical protein